MQFSLYIVTGTVVNKYVDNTLVKYVKDKSHKIHDVDFEKSETAKAY